MKDLTELQALWQQIEAIKSLEDLKSSLQTVEYSEKRQESLRSAYWKAFLLFEDVDYHSWPKRLSDSRTAYDSLRKKYLYVLEHSDEIDSFLDPLSDEFDSPWNSIRTDEAARQEILVDVQRCMPDNLFFRQPETQTMLLDILFVWSKMNPDTGYRQGMHEILAPVLWVVERDALDKSSSRSPKAESSVNIIESVFDNSYVAHDAFGLFQVIMRHVKAGYEHIEPKSGRQQSRSESSIVARSNRIVYEHLHCVDPCLSDHLSELEIAPQMFLLRWIRLLFGREFPLNQLLRLWDRIFAEGLTSDRIDLACVAKLLYMRWDIISADYNTALQILLHSQLKSDYTADSLIDDTLYIERHMQPSGGQYVISKRTDRTPQLPEDLASKGSASIDSKDSPSRALSASARSSKKSARLPGKLDSLIHDAARGVYTRGEQWGLNQAVREAMGEIRKNVQDIQTRTHSRSVSRTGFIDEPGAQLSRQQLVQTIDSMKTRNQGLAKMLGRAVEELWEEQKSLTQGASTTKENMENLTTAIAKAQFVQIYLEDEAVNLPIEGDQLSAPEQFNSSARKKKDEAQTNPGSQELNEHIKPSESDEGTIRQGKEQVDHEIGQHQASGPEILQEEKKERPPLAQSTFSWMLGQEERHSTTARSVFVSASPFTEQRTKTQSSKKNANAYLFGDVDEGQEDEGYRMT